MLHSVCKMWRAVKCRVKCGESVGVTQQFAHTNTPFNTLATELLRGNSPGLRFATFSIIMHYADTVHLTAAV